MKWSLVGGLIGGILPGAVVPVISIGWFVLSQMGCCSARGAPETVTIAGLTFGPALLALVGTPLAVMIGAYFGAFGGWLAKMRLEFLTGCGGWTDRV